MITEDRDLGNGVAIGGNSYYVNLFDDAYNALCIKRNKAGYIRQAKPKAFPQSCADCLCSCEKLLKYKDRFCKSRVKRFREVK